MTNVNFNLFYGLLNDDQNIVCGYKLSKCFLLQIGFEDSIIHDSGSYQHLSKGGRNEFESLDLCYQEFKIQNLQTFNFSTKNFLGAKKIIKNVDSDGRITYNFYFKEPVAYDCSFRLCKESFEKMGWKFQSLIRIN